MEAEGKTQAAANSENVISNLIKRENIWVESSPLLLHIFQTLTKSSYNCPSRELPLASFIIQETKLTPLRSLRPLGWRMLTYLEAMRNPMKQTVNTLAMGSTAYLSMLSTDVPSVPPCATVASTSSSDLSIMAWPRPDYWSLLFLASGPSDPRNQDSAII